MIKENEQILKEIKYIFRNRIKENFELSFYYNDYYQELSKKEKEALYKEFISEFDINTFEEIMIIRLDSFSKRYSIDLKDYVILEMFSGIILNEIAESIISNIRKSGIDEVIHKSYKVTKSNIKSASKIFNTSLYKLVDVILNWDDIEYNDELPEDTATLPFIEVFLNWTFHKYEILFSIATKDKEELQKKINKLGKLYISNPQEQRLFELVKKEYDSAPPYYNIKPYQTFKIVNDRMNLIPPEAIIEKGFTNTPLYNRFTQFKYRKSKKSKKP